MSKRKKEYPLLIESGDYCYSKGHHDKEEFAYAVNECFNIKLDPEKIRYTHWRFVPDWEGQEHGCYWESSPGRGAFPVTVWEP